MFKIRVHWLDSFNGLTLLFLHLVCNCGRFTCGGLAWGSGVTLDWPFRHKLERIVLCLLLWLFHVMLSVSVQINWWSSGIFNTYYVNDWLRYILTQCTSWPPNKWVHISSKMMDPLISGRYILSTSPGHFDGIQGLICMDFPPWQESGPDHEYSCLTLPPHPLHTSHAC